jgi:hypothetical protein
MDAAVRARSMWNQHSSGLCMPPFTLRRILRNTIVGCNDTEKPTGGRRGWTVYFDHFLSHDDD